MNDQQQGDYRQQLGLKKILYKYQNQNQQLRSQIKALNERLQTILQKSKTPQKKPSLNPIQQYQGQLMKQQMQKLFKEINRHSQEMKINKDGIDQRHQQKCTLIQNKIIKEDKQIKELKHKLDRYEKLDQGIKLNDMLKSGALNNNFQTINSNNVQVTGLIPNNQSPQKTLKETSIATHSPLMYLQNKTLRSSTVRIQNYFQKLANLLQQTQAVRKSIKQLQRERDQNQRNLIKIHTFQTDIKGHNRTLQYGKVQTIIQENTGLKKGGVVGMNNTKENYEFIKKEIQNLKNQKQTTLSAVKNQNSMLQSRIKQLQYQLDGLHKSIQIPPLPYMKRPMKIPIDLSISTRFEPPSPLIMRKSLKPLDVSRQQFQSHNDKNFIPKKIRTLQWQSSTKNKSGIEWNDSQLKSPIIGVNLWFQGCLLGIQFIHTLGNSNQHIQIMGGKKLIPIQYRVVANDYIQNVILYISDALIYGVQFITKNGRLDKFGTQAKARKFDFGIKKPQKPVVSFGQFRVNNNISQITKLGFQIM